MLIKQADGTEEFRGPREYTSDILRVNTTPFKDKTVAICGASRGTGLATVKYLLIRGASVSMASSCEERITAAFQEVVKELPEHKDRVVAYKCDIRNLEEVEAWIGSTVERFGKLDACANVAGMNQPSHSLGYH